MKKQKGKGEAYEEKINQPYVRNNNGCQRPDRMWRRRGRCRRQCAERATAHRIRGRDPHHCGGYRARGRCPNEKRRRKTAERLPMQRKMRAVMYRSR